MGLLCSLEDKDINEEIVYHPKEGLELDIKIPEDQKMDQEILEIIDLEGKVKESEAKEEPNPRANEPLFSLPPGGKPAPPPKVTCAMYFFCMFRKFFNIKNGTYQELPMNPLPPPMRTLNVTRQYLGELDKRTAAKNKEREEKKKASPELKDTDFPNESYWDLSKTIAIVKPTLRNACEYRFIQNGMEFSMPFFMRFYLKELKQPEDERRLWYLLMLAFLAVIFCFIGGVCRERANFYTGATKAKAGQAMRSLVYKRLAQADFMFLLNVNAGLVTRFGMAEVDGILSFIGSISDMISSPVYILGTFIYLLIDVGPLALVIIVILCFCLSWLCYLNYYTVKKQRTWSNEGNDRAIALREMIPNIDEVKKCGFEDFFHCKLNQKRNSEMDALMSMHKIQNLLNFSFELTFLIGAFLNVTFYINEQPSGTPLNTGVTFSQIALVNGMRGNFREIMEIIVNFNEYSLSKISMDLQLNQVQIKPEESEGYKDQSMEKGAIKGVNCEFGVNDNHHLEILDKLKKTDLQGGSDKKELDVFEVIQKVKDDIDDEARVEKKKHEQEHHHEVNPQFENCTVIFNQNSFDIKRGEKICICGAEDDGKSMFLFSLLGETELMSGSLKYNGVMNFLSFKRAAFVSGTVRDNITLYGRFNARLYEKACEVAMLNTGRMPGDDFMLVNDSGGNLFPKEKLQILVARLVYQDSDILVVDDFLDYLTPQLRDMYSRNIIEYCEETKKTLLYVSAYEQLARRSDKIFYFNNCFMVENGSYQELKNKEGGAFAKFITKRPDSRPQIKKHTTNKIINTPEWITEVGKEDHELDQKMAEKKIKQRAQGKTDMLAQKLDIKQEQGEIGDGPNLKQAIVNLMKTSIKRREGNVLEGSKEVVVSSIKDTLLVRYLLIEGKGRLAWQIFVGFLAVMAGFAIDVWLVLIAMKKLNSLDLMVQIYIWGVIALVYSAVIWFRDSNIRRSMSANSNTLYRRCVKKLLCTRMDWFQKNSASGLVYLLTEDITKIDYHFNEAKMDFIEVCFNLLIAALVCNALLWLLMTIPLIIGLYFFYPFFAKYLMAVQYFYKMEQTHKANLLSMFLQTYEGAIMFRNMGKPRFFDSRFADANETFQRATTHLNNVCGRFIGVRNFVLNTYFVFLVYFIPIIIKEGIHKSNDSLWLSAGWMMPLAISWTYKLIRYFNKLFGILAAMSKYMLSIQKTLDFMDHEFIEDLDPGKIDCKASGPLAIECNQAEMSYGFNSKSLFNLNQKIEKGKRIAIVGGPYSGKHSLVNMLLKLYERIDQEETDSRVYKGKELFENSAKWFNEYLNEIESENPEKYPKIGSHPNRDDPNSMGTAFQIWTGFVTKIQEREKKQNPESLEEKAPKIESFVKVLGQDLTECSPFELRKHCSYLSPKAMMYNGTVLENIDFAGEFKKDKWKIVKILSYLGFFDALIESMNLDDALVRFKKDLFDPAFDMKSEDYDEKIADLESPLKNKAPRKIPKKETVADKAKREQEEANQYEKDLKEHNKIEKAQLKKKTLSMGKMEEKFEIAQREKFINNSYIDVEREENVKSPLKKMNTFQLMENYDKSVKTSQIQIGLKGDQGNLMDSGIQYIPPTAGKQEREELNELDQERLDKDKVRQLMKKVYERQNLNQYTNEDLMLLKIAEEDWMYKTKEFKKNETNPIAKTLKDYLGSRLAYHKTDKHKAMIIHDILEAEVKPNGENFGISLRKIINAARSLLQNKAILMCDDDSLMCAESPTLMDDVFNELKDNTVITVVNDLENLLYFDKVLVVNDGFIVEEGDPKKLLLKRDSLLFSTLKDVDQGMYDLLDNALLQGWKPKKIFQSLFRIPSWFKKLGYKVPLFDRK